MKTINLIWRFLFKYYSPVNYLELKRVKMFFFYLEIVKRFGHHLVAGVSPEG